jgi:ABC-2 type transport system permease protein
MSKVWRVIRYEYLRHVLRKGFLIAVLAVPFWIVVMLLVVFLLIRLESNNKPIGYVDHSGVLAKPIPVPEPEPPDQLVPMQAFASEQLARQALENNDIQAYYVIAADYLNTHNVQLFYKKQPRSSASSQFREFLGLNLLTQVPRAVAIRVIEGPNLKVVAIGDNTEAQGLGLVLRFLAPMFTALALMVAIFTSSGYLMQAVVEEKENRTMEIMITSVSPEQMMSGKVIGLIGVGLTQILIWLILGLAVLLLVVRNFDFIKGINLGLSNFWLALVVIFPAFVLISALMAAVGATVTEAREGQQVTGLITLPVMLPIILFGVILNSPNGLLAVILSLFPLTAPLTIIMRASLTTIPTWQIVLSVTLLVLSAIGALWLAGRIFRVGMLRYGKRVRLREIFTATGPA